MTAEQELVAGLWICAGCQARHAGRTRAYTIDGQPYDARCFRTQLGRLYPDDPHISALLGMLDDADERLNDEARAGQRAVEDAYRQGETQGYADGRRSGQWA